MGIDNDLDEYNRTSTKNLNQYQDVINQNTGLNGFNNSLNTARAQSQQGALNTTASATNQAIQSAQQAGLSKAAAAMNAGNTAASTYANAYATGVNANQNAIQNFQNQAVQAASDVYNKQQQVAQTKLNTAIAEYQRKMQRVQQVISIAMKVGSAVASKGATMKGATGSNADIAQSMQSEMANPNYTATYGNQQGLMNFASAPSTFNSGFNVGTQQMGFYSDERLKEPIDKADEFFKKLKAIEFKYKDKYQKSMGLDDEEHIGISAQDVEEADPDMVTEKNGKKAIDIQKLAETTAAAIALLSKEIK